MQEIALFSGKIYTAGTNFTRPPVVTVATNLNSDFPFPENHIFCLKVIPKTLLHKLMAFLSHFLKTYQGKCPKERVGPFERGVPSIK